MQKEKPRRIAAQGLDFGWWPALISGIAAFPSAAQLAMYQDSHLWLEIVEYEVLSFRVSAYASTKLVGIALYLSNGMFNNPKEAITQAVM